MLRLLGLFATTTAALVACVVTSADAGFDLETSFATKTAYWDQADDKFADKIKHLVKELDEDEEKRYTLVQVQQVVRHGTRFPTESNIEEITEFVTRLQANYSNVLPKWLRSYKMPFNVSVEGLLAPTGVKELQEFGKRTRASVAKALPSEFTSDKFILQHTYKPRTKLSATSFASSFFSNPQNVTYIEYSKKNDPLLRFYDQCPRYERDVGENPEALAELTKYKQTLSYQKNIDTLRKALNLPTSANLTTLDVESAFSACAFDLALYKTKENWCSLLTKDFIKSAEYAEELETFYESGAGFKINYEMSAVLLQDVFKFMKNFANNKTQVVGNFRFSHAETTLPLMTLLGYADKTPLLASFTAKEINQRKFRASRLAPFMANIEFRLYKKNKSKDDDDDDDDDEEDQSEKQVAAKKEKFYVQIRINEQVTLVPGCDDEIFCDLSEVEQIWSYYLTQYNFEQDCKI